jgi:hypothetical protein
MSQNQSPHLTVLSPGLFYLRHRAIAPAPRERSPCRSACYGKVERWGPSSHTRQIEWLADASAASRFRGADVMAMCHSTISKTLALLRSVW